MDLALLPTPLHPAPALARALGLGDRELWIKRDDLVGPGLGGNKVRKLARLLPEAVTAGHDTVVTVGAAQSNHARLTAVCAAMTGLECHLVLSGPPSREGSALLGALAGATLHPQGDADWLELGAAAERIADELREAGRSPVVVPLGGTTVTGASAYAQAYEELIGQLGERGVEPGWVVHASSTGGTQAGLVTGRVTGDGRGPRVLGCDVIGGGDGLRGWVRELAGQVAGAPVDEDEVHLAAATGEGYGIPSAEGDEAVRAALRHAGLVLDPVYSGKALAALAASARDGVLAADERPVVFLHTGGAPAVFAERYARSLLAG